MTDLVVDATRLAAKVDDSLRWTDWVEVAVDFRVATEDAAAGIDNSPELVRLAAWQIGVLADLAAGLEL